MAELVDAEGLTDRDKVFCLAYRANGFKSASSAYHAAYPQANVNTCRTEGPRRLGKPAVDAWVRKAFVEHLATVEALGSEMLGRVVLDARADVRDCFGEDGKLLPVAAWPDRLANSVEGIEFLGKDRQGNPRYKIKLVSKAGARRTVLEATGKLNNPLNEQVSALAKAIRGVLGVEEGSKAATA